MRALVKSTARAAISSHSPQPNLIYRKSNCSLAHSQASGHSVPQINKLY